MHMVALCLLLMRRMIMILAVEMRGVVLSALGGLGHDVSRFAEVPGICDDGTRRYHPGAKAARKKGHPGRRREVPRRLAVAKRAPRRLIRDPII